MQVPFGFMLLCELVTKNPALKELILRPPILNVSFHPKGCQAVATYSGYGGHRLCVPVEGCVVFEWLLIDMEPKPIQEPNCILQPLENCCVRGLHPKAALKGSLPGEEEAIMKPTGLGSDSTRRSLLSKL